MSASEPWKGTIENQRKYLQEIEDVEIKENKNYYSTFCFHFKFPGTDFHSISIKYLTKSSRTSKLSPEENNDRNKKAILIQTLRETIQFQINEWKKENNDTRKNSDEADHYPKSFKEISEEFINNNGSKIVQSNDQLKSKTLNGDIEKNWIEFHKANAKLRWIPKEENRPGRPKKQKIYNF
jgi:hypothetical protein